MTRAALALALAATLLAGPAAAAPPDSLATPGGLRFGPRDAVFGAVAAGALALAATHDRRGSAEAAGNDTRVALDLAADAKRLGDPVTVGAALLATDLGARALGHPRLGAATERIALACVAAGLATAGAKLALGRERPDENADPGVFRPFSHHDALPSGHATTAFALAAALDAETRTPVVPAIAYPLAAVTAWSRVRDQRHWPSDVVAGAALGGWIAHHADRWAQQRLPQGLWVIVFPAHHGAAARAGLRF